MYMIIGRRLRVSEYCTLHVSINRKAVVEWENELMTSSSREQRSPAESCPFGAVAKHLLVPVSRPTAVR